MDSQAGVINVNQAKTPQHTLVRVRNNQRRHRQRRREYVESLERKLKAMEETASRLGIENEALRKQLSCQPHPRRVIPPHTAVDTSGTNMTAHIGGYGETQHSPVHTSPMASSHATGAMRLPSAFLTSRDRTNLNDTTGLWETLLSSNMSATLFPDLMIPSSYAAQPPASQYPSPCCSASPSDTGVFGKDTGWRVDSISRPLDSCRLFLSSTTHCAQAYLIIQHRNRRGLSLDVIESWLWPGFMYTDETAEIGCRVDSRLLFGLLVYIDEDPDIEASVLEQPRSYAR